jgi:metal-responsive CopG/Arc/MetJ family transcriptional regulator
MKSETIRLNITLPSALAEQLKHISGPRKQSQFVAEALEQRIKQLKKKQMEKALAEGYKANSKEGLAITKEFESVDLEDWDAY